MPDGENCVQVMERLEKFFQKLKRGKKPIVVVTHDLVLRLILARILGLSINHIWRIKLDNGAINIVEWGRQKRVVLINDTARLISQTANIDNQAL